MKMKKWIIWSFERGSFQYDVLCVLILLVVFLIPSAAFNDRPDYMRISDPEPVRRVFDDDGSVVYAVKVESASPEAGALELAARERLQSFLRSPEPVRVRRVEPVTDSLGRVAAYAFWLRDDPDEDN